MSIGSSSAKPFFAMFLDIDGVLYNKPDQSGVFEKAKGLFPKRWQYNRECSIAATYFFDPTAIQSLNDLICKIGKTATVQIVISSSWRLGESVEELKNIFKLHAFSHYIFDKILDAPLTEDQLKSCCTPESHLSCSSRAAKIQYWLATHPEVRDYAILDDEDTLLSSTFGKRFFQTLYQTLLTPKISEEIFMSYVRESTHATDTL